MDQRKLVLIFLGGGVGLLLAACLYFAYECFESPYGLGLRMVRAAEAKDWAKVKALLEAGANPNETASAPSCGG